MILEQLGKVRKIFKYPLENVRGGSKVANSRRITKVVSVSGDFLGNVVIQTPSDKCFF